MIEHLAWFAAKGFDYVRILGEVDWEGRSIEPSWPDYVQVLREFVDMAYGQFGLRVEVTILGGRQYEEGTGVRRYVPVEVARTVATALEDRQHAVMLFEMANEWDRLDKVSGADLIEMAAIVESLNANLVALSNPGGDGYGQMRSATDVANASAYVIHPRRSKHDHGWSHVRQGYDFKDFDRAYSITNRRGRNRLWCRWIVRYSWRVRGRSGLSAAARGTCCISGPGCLASRFRRTCRPADVWDVPGIDAMVEAVRGVDVLLPSGVENWQVVNNGRSTHPLPLHPHDGFWEGDMPGPAVNKNYAAISGDQFVVMLIGVKSAGTTGPVPAGTARRACVVEASDPVTRLRVASATLAAGQSWTVPGRGDTMAAYVVRGRYLSREREWNA